jgi:hypothetical protein
MALEKLKEKTTETIAEEIYSKLNSPTAITTIKWKELTEEVLTAKITTKGADNLVQAFARLGLFKNIPHELVTNSLLENKDWFSNRNVVHILAVNNYLSQLDPSKITKELLLNKDFNNTSALGFLLKKGKFSEIPWKLLSFFMLENTTENLDENKLATKLITLVPQMLKKQLCINLINTAFEKNKVTEH